MPLLREPPGPPGRRVGPGEVLRLMREEGLGVGGGATYFLTSLLDHPDFTPEHLALMPFAGLGGSPVPVAVTAAGDRARDHGVPLLREHRAPLHHRVPPRRPRGEAADHRRPAAARGGAPARRGRRDPQPRPRLLRRLHRCRADRRASSTPTGGTTPVTSACWTTRATSPSPTASPTSSSGAARTSARPEIEELMARMRRGGRGVRGGRARRPPRGARGRRAPRARGHGAAHAGPGAGAIWPGPAWPARSGPSRSHEVDEFPRTPSGKVQKFRLRQQLREGRPRDGRHGENAILGKQ